MLRNVILICAVLLLNGGGAFAEDDVSARIFRYAILIDDHEPIYGEVECAKYPCQLVSHRAPDIDLSLSRYDDYSVRPVVYCKTENCFISYRSGNIALSQTGKLQRFRLAEGHEPGRHAVILESRYLGEIIIAF